MPATGNAVPEFDRPRFWPLRQERDLPTPFRLLDHPGLERSVVSALAPDLDAINVFNAMLLRIRGAEQVGI